MTGRAHYTVTFYPGPAAPRGGRVFDSPLTCRTLAEAKRHAQNYLSTYPERRQEAAIFKHERVATIK